jgi:ubiquinone/menaquinone biosynthesis C-methylase UbiE
VRDVGGKRTGFNDVDCSAALSYFIEYLDGARKAPVIIQAKEWTFEHLHLTDGQRVLDVGCGTGEDVFAIASIIGPRGRAIGVDSSMAMVSEAQERHGHLPEVIFQVGDAQRLPFESETFDSCRTERTLQHLADPDKAVSEMTRVLKRGGRIALIEPDWETLVIEGTDAALSTKILGEHIEQIYNLVWVGGCGDSLPPMGSMTWPSQPVWSCTQTWRLQGGPLALPERR